MCVRQRRGRIRRAGAVLTCYRWEVLANMGNFRFPLFSGHCLGKNSVFLGSISSFEGNATPSSHTQVETSIRHADYARLDDERTG